MIWSSNIIYSPPNCMSCTDHSANRVNCCQSFPDTLSLDRESSTSQTSYAIEQCQDHHYKHSSHQNDTIRYHINILYKC